MFFRGSNNNNNGINVNTSFFTSYSDTAMVKLGGWNQQLSLKVHPFVGKDAEGVNQYAQDQSQLIITSITQDNAKILESGFEDNIKDAIKNKTASKKYSISVGVNEKRKIISIFYDGKDAYLEVVTGVSENGIASDENVLRHKFNKKSCLVDYDYKDGSGVEQEIEVEFLNFMDKIKSAKDLTPIVAHSIQYSNAVRNSFKGRNNNQHNNIGENTSYSAPVTSNLSDNMDFLPFQ